ncbi:MAG: hypothetical protein QGH55_06190, partial [Acidimicrobiales bacterium]|nr:hypothetical protein [Acidimicrobiales bacterium]
AEEKPAEPVSRPTKVVKTPVRGGMQIYAAGGDLIVLAAVSPGAELLADGTSARTFDLAFDLVRRFDLGNLVSATYPLDRYQDAIQHASSAGSRGAVKIAFDLRDEKERYRP